MFRTTTIRTDDGQNEKGIAMAMEFSEITMESKGDKETFEFV